MPKQKKIKNKKSPYLWKILLKSHLKKSLKVFSVDGWKVCLFVLNIIKYNKGNLSKENITILLNPLNFSTFAPEAYLNI